MKAAAIAIGLSLGLALVPALVRIDGGDWKPTK